jgi:D-glucosaminate-6-phosphate ammonia-lyase
MVTAGAASAMTLGTAGVLTGTDRLKIVNLPNLRRHEVRGDHPEVAPLRLRPRRPQLRRPADRGRDGDELERAINVHTAMMLFYNNNNTVGQIRDEEFVRARQKHGIPTFNDAAADVPPVENLWKYTAMGFDLVTFSGGKGLRGPAERRAAAREARTSSPRHA